MVQREVADRVAAHPGTSDYGALSAATQMYARVEKLMTLPPEAFSPPPQVHSTVLRLTMAPRFEELRVGADGFLPFLRCCFAQKRKMLAKNLRNAAYETSDIAAAFEACGIPVQARAEQVALEGMACLFRRLTVT
jgi:16S rRNA (adenine1518-N6/adenine1519-N6)-dimethyltransferase